MCFSKVQLQMAYLALEKRDYCGFYYCESNSNWVWGRWILFVLFIVFLVALFTGTRFLNKKRGTHGQVPIRGTAWMTPPSYFQSQRQYNQPINPNGPSEATYVPPYTKDTQPYDAGHYDNRGDFHANSHTDTRAVIPDYTGVSKPEEVHTTAQAADFDSDFPAFYGHRDTELQNLRPAGPPPVHDETGSSDPSIPSKAHAKN